MISAGLTGNVACGKSTVAGLFEELGAGRIDADLLVRELLGPGGAAEEAVLERFPSACSAGGGIDRAALARLVFADPDERRALEALLHPLVVAESRRRLAQLERRGHDLVVTEAALLLEAARAGTAGADSLDRFDALLVVTCDPEVQRRRALRRGMDAGLSEEEAEADFERRLAAQLPQDEKAAAADWIIDNSGPLEETERQVEAVREALLRKGAA